MELLAIVGLVLAAAMLAVLLRRDKPELAMAVGILAGVGVLAAVLANVTPALGRLTQMMMGAGVSGAYTGAVMKGLGICLLTQLASDVCRDAGEGGLASKVELAGKAALLVVALPLFEQLASLAVSLMEGA